MQCVYNKWIDPWETKALKNQPDTILTLAPQYGASPHTRHTKFRLKTMPFMDAKDKDWDTLW